MHNIILFACGKGIGTNCTNEQQLITIVLPAAKSIATEAPKH
jgi:galactitol-specific phosphotransferase system IIB component